MKNNVVLLTGMFLIGMFSTLNVNAQGDQESAETNNSNNQDVVDSIKRLNPETLLDAAPYGFSQIVIPPEGTTIYISGQGSIAVNGSVIGNTLEQQLQTAFDNIKLALESSNAKPEDVVKIVISIAGYKPEFYDTVTSERLKFFGNNLPASTIIPVPTGAWENLLVEIDAIAVIPEKVAEAGNATRGAVANDTAIFTNTSQPIGN